MKSKLRKGLVVAALAVPLGLFLTSGATSVRAHQGKSDDRLREVGFDSSVLTIFERACQDCHSDNTEWPWYSRLEPASSLIAADVEKGRKFMNLSRWGEYSHGRKLGYLISIDSAVDRGSMPPRPYRMLHWEANLSEEEREDIRRWTQEERKRLIEARRSRGNP